MIAVVFVAGLVAWTFAEYAIHNWYGHVAKGRNEFSREHLKHHAVKGYFAATRKKVLVALSVLAALAAAAAPLVGAGIALAFTSGFALAYAGYEVLHRRLHTHGPRGPYGRWARRHHFHHHFANPKANHGVTSPLWDLVFRTYERPGVVRVPEKHAMDWLVDGRGELRPALAGDYRILSVRPGRAG